MNPARPEGSTVLRTMGPPGEYAEITAPGRFLAPLGEEVARRVENLTGEPAGGDQPGEEVARSCVPGREHRRDPCHLTGRTMTGVPPR